MNIENLLLKISQDDLKSAIILHTQKQFRNSYFLFQQAVEKANKAFLLFSGIISENEIKKIGHNQFKPYRKEINNNLNKVTNTIPLINSNEVLKTNNLIKQIDFENQKENLVVALKYIDSLQNYDLVNISEKELKILIDDLNEVKNIKLEVSDEIINEKIAELFRITDNDISKELKALSKKLLKLLPDLIFIQQTLFVCAHITIKHSSLTRYPEKGKNPLLIYNEKLPLIKQFPLFAKLLKSALQKLQKFINLKEMNKRKIYVFRISKGNKSGNPKGSCSMDYSEIQQKIRNFDDKELDVIDYNRLNHIEFIKNELWQNNILRQGWGLENLDLNAETNQWIKNYMFSAKKYWNIEIDCKRAKGRWNIINRMKEMNENDIIIIPKTSRNHIKDNNTFVICQVDKEYYFDLHIKMKDYGHCIKVKNIKEFKYSDENIVRKDFSSPYLYAITEVKSNHKKYKLFTDFIKNNY